MKVKSKILLVLMLSIALVGLSGCFGKEKAATDDSKKTVETKETAKANDTTTTTETTKANGTTATKETTKTNGTTDTKATTKTNDTATSKETAKTKTNSTTSTKTSGSKTTNGTTTTTGNKQSDNSSKPKNEEKEISDFVLQNTKLVKIFNISRRVHEQHPDLGPFFFVRGIDARGQKSEIWIKDMKVFEMVNTN
ncbi:hypothetical protein [Neobacillus sp. PS2-9]|uniref:hypothetical protein n=1 Tax=Neobacillus sp. PS2-9 TaxID=3070676 RepID=UPI0027DEABEF|nr:hypothetical protein [Neobacillus sp. PS2-9]WML58585.1 hypothetical protein RCG25_01985 [Neobacillus sp. PS2-9]